MQERGLAIRKDINKVIWERNDFPILCNNCLGDNPFIRMQQASLDKECNLCSRPYTVFRWKAGTKGRMKQCVICQTCSKLKNCCQSCLYDLEYGLPIEIRDKYLAKNKVELPGQSANRDYFIDQANKNLDKLSLPYNQGHDKILNEVKSIEKQIQQDENNQEEQEDKQYAKKFVLKKQKKLKNQQFLIENKIFTGEILRRVFKNQLTKEEDDLKNKEENFSNKKIKPNPPILPPPQHLLQTEKQDEQKINSQNQQLINILQQNASNNKYPSMDPSYYGGEQFKKKL